MNQLDCLRLHVRLQKLKNKQSKDWHLYLPLLRIEVDLRTNEAKMDGMFNRKFKLIRSDSGIR